MSEGGAVEGWGRKVGEGGVVEGLVRRVIRMGW